MNFLMETQMQVEIRATPKETFPDVDRFIKLKEDSQVASPEEIAEKLVNTIKQRTKFKNGNTYTPVDLA